MNSARVVKQLLWLQCVAYIGGTSVAMPIPTGSEGRRNRLPSAGSTSSGFSQSPASMQGPPSISSLFTKPDSQPGDVSNSDLVSSTTKGVPRRQPRRRSGLATLPSVGAIP